jgi:hypothetical protein
MMGAVTARLDHPQGGRLVLNVEVHSQPAIPMRSKLARGMPDRLLPEKDATVARDTSEQMLWALGDEVPEQMAEAECVGFGCLDGTGRLK